MFFNIVGGWCLISLKQQDKNPGQTNLSTINDFKAVSDAYFDENKSFILNDKNVILQKVLLQNALHKWLIFLLVLFE